MYDREVMGDAPPVVFSENGKAQCSEKVARALASKYDAITVLKPAKKKADKANGGEEDDE
jgi:hypothetical protein